MHKRAIVLFDRRNWVFVSCGPHSEKKPWMIRERIYIQTIYRHKVHMWDVLNVPWGWCVESSLSSRGRSWRARLMSSAGRRGDGAGRETRLPYRVSAEFDNFGDVVTCRPGWVRHHLF